MRRRRRWSCRGIGAATALIAALIALTQNDLKRVLAYSTVSQLGYMFMALGAGAAGAEVGHAGGRRRRCSTCSRTRSSRRCCSSSAGSVMHAMGDVIDMRRFSGLRRVLPITHWTFLCGAAALAGVPLLSGFWSKDEILAVLCRRVAIEPTHGTLLHGDLRRRGVRRRCSRRSTRSGRTS